MSAIHDSSLVVLTLDLQGELFAIHASEVREILDLVPVTDVPGADASMHGVINVRGRVVPLADLRLKFGMEQLESTIDSRIVVVEVEIEGDAVTLGIRADRVYEVTELAAASLEETPRIGLTWPAEYISCIGKRGADFIAVLDLGRVFARAATQAGQSEREAAVQQRDAVAAPGP